MTLLRSLRNPALYVAHHGARYLFPLVITPLYAHTFGPSEFADFVIWNSCVWSASLFMEYGFFLYAINETARSETREQLGVTLSQVMSAKIVLFPIALCIYALLTTLTGLIARHPAAVAMGLFAMASYGGSFAWYFQGQERAGTAVTVEAVPQVFQFLMILLLVRHAEDLWIAALLQTLAAVCTTGFAFALIARDRLVWQLSMSGVRQAIAASTPFFVERLCLTLYQTANPLFITSFSAKAEVAYYSVGDKFFQFLGGLSIPLSYALLPGISRRMASKTDWRFSVRVVAIVTGLTAVLAIASFFGARYVISLLFSPLFVPAVAVAQCFCIAALFVSYNACVANFILLPVGRASVLIRTSVVALVISLSSQAFLLPQYGALGSAAARLLAEAGVAVILTIVAARLVSASQISRTTVQ